MATKKTQSGPPKRHGRPPGTKNPPGAKVGRPQKNLSAATAPKAAKDSASEPAAKKPKTSHPAPSAQTQLAHAGRAEKEVRSMRSTGPEESAAESAAIVLWRNVFCTDLTNNDSDNDDAVNTSPSPAPSTRPASPFLGARTSLAPSPPSSAQPTPAIDLIQLPDNSRQAFGTASQLCSDQQDSNTYQRAEHRPVLLPDNLDSEPANIGTYPFVPEAVECELAPPLVAADMADTLAALVLNGVDSFTLDETSEESLDDILEGMSPDATSEDDICMDDLDDDEDCSDNHQEGSQTASAPLTTQAKSHTTWQSQPRSSIPTWLASRYNSLCDALSQQCRSNLLCLPTCYDSGTFELAPPAPIFSTRHVAQLSPSLFYGVRFFIWLPHLFGRIPCPQCKKAGRSRDNGSPVLLQCLRWPQAPRRAVDIEENVYVVGYCYRCTHDSCKKTYLSWSHSILEALPPLLFSQFTFHCTQRCALTDRVVALLRHMFQHGIGASPFTNTICTFHIRRNEQLALQYLEAVKLRLNSPILSFSVRPERFSAWDDWNSFAGYVPSATCFLGFYNQYIEGHAPEIDKQMSMLSACF
ncbi:hypothetical protein BC835DRAFT_1522456, partial [Cytidiella melzeri]